MYEISKQLVKISNESTFIVILIQMFLITFIDILADQTMMAESKKKLFLLLK